MGKIVEATGIASGVQYSTTDVQAVMAKTVEKCLAAGISDPDKIREAMLKARQEYIKGKTA